MNYYEPWVSLCKANTIKTSDMGLPDENPEFILLGEFECFQYNETSGEWESVGNCFIWEGVIYSQIHVATESSEPAVGSDVQEAYLEYRGDLKVWDLDGEMFSVAELNSSNKLIDYNKRPADYTMTLPPDQDTGSHYVVFDDGMSDPDFPEDLKPVINKIVNREPYKLVMVCEDTGKKYFFDETCEFNSDEFSWSTSSTEGYSYIRSTNGGNMYFGEQQLN